MQETSRTGAALICVGVTGRLYGACKACCLPAGRLVSNGSLLSDCRLESSLCCWRFLFKTRTSKDLSVVLSLACAKGVSGWLLLLGLAVWLLQAVLAVDVLMQPGLRKLLIAYGCICMRL